MPQVSVLVAAFDAATTIGAALDSIGAQEFQDWECVVVDDGSTDGTAQLVAERGAADPRFRLLRQAHQGVVAARNSGLAACRGEFVALFDADDLMFPRRLATQVEMLRESPQLGGVGCHVEYFPREACGEGRIAYESWLNRHATLEDLCADRFIEMPIGHPTLMLRADFLWRSPYRDLGWPEDWDLMLRLFAIGMQLGVVPEVLHRWRLSDDSLSRTSPTYTDDAFTRCRAHFLAHDFLAYASSYGLIGYGNTGKALRKALLPHTKNCDAIYELHPGRIGQVLDGARVWHHDRLQERVPHKLLVSVAGAEARAFLRERLSGWGYRDTVDFICTA